MTARVDEKEHDLWQPCIDGIVGVDSRIFMVNQLQILEHSPLQIYRGPPTNLAHWIFHNI